METVAIIQARMGSTRLPGKVLELIGKYPAIYHTYQRTRLAVPNTVVAIPASPENDPLADYLATIGAPCFRWDGPEDDVLGRYAACAAKFNADVVVRITGDCPLVDAVDISTMLTPSSIPMAYRWNGQFVPHGRDVEVWEAAFLRERHAVETDPWCRQHVKPNNAAWRWPIRRSGTPLELNTPADLAWFRTLATHLDFTPPHPTTAELLAFLEAHHEHVRLDTGSA